MATTASHTAEPFPTISSHPSLASRTWAFRFVPTNLPKYAEDRAIENFRFRHVSMHYAKAGILHGAALIGSDSHIKLISS